MSRMGCYCLCVMTNNNPTVSTKSELVRLIWQHRDECDLPKLQTCWPLISFPVEDLLRRLPKAVRDAHTFCPTLTGV
jgi:hypothetical protein